MNNTVSNYEIIQIFKQIDELKDIKSIIKLHDEIILCTSFLVINLVEKYKKVNNYEDLKQEGLLGLVKATKRFNYHRFPNFFSFAIQWIRNHVLRAAKKHDIIYSPSREKVLYLEDLLKEDEMEEDTPESIYFKKQQKKYTNSEIKTLSKVEQEIVSKMYGIGTVQQSLREIAPNYRITHERVRQINQNALQKLKNNKILQEIRQVGE